MKKNLQYECLSSVFQDIDVYTFCMKVKDVVNMYYVAVRGVDHEEGAVQRVLKLSRVSAVKDYILQGNTFFNSFILNWTEEKKLPVVKGNKISLPIVSSAAQVIDGQHRLAGFEAAMEEDASIGETEIIITMCIGLDTSQAANIFLNINTEQKPVPKSLIYDLFGETVDDKTHSVNRARDIAKELNDDPESALYKLIRFPGSPRGVGVIELSTFVSALKEPLKSEGVFRTFKLSKFDAQRVSIFNFFNCLKEFYDEKEMWFEKSKNPFQRAAGFNGAMDFFVNVLIQKCAEKGSFTKKTMRELIALDKEGLITWDDLKGFDGKTSRRKVKEALEANILSSMSSHKKYEF